MDKEDFDYKSYILQHFTYNDDGTCSRDDYPSCNGTYDKDGYLIYKIKGKKFRSHRIVWLLNTGDFPSGEIDHINRIRDDNRIENLRECNRLQQMQNITSTPNKQTGFCGVHIDTTNGLKKKYAFAFQGKTYRYYNAEEAYISKMKLHQKMYESKEFKEFFNNGCNKQATYYTAETNRSEGSI